MTRCCVQLVIIAVLLDSSGILRAQEGTLVRTGIEEATEILTAQAEKKGAAGITEVIARLGGETGMREIFDQVAKDEGENGVKTLLSLTKEYGVDAILAAKVAPRATVTFIEKIPPELVPGALRALTRTGERTIVERLEPELVPAALEASARHPGIGAQAVDKLGIAGARASQLYDTDALIQLLRSPAADSIAALPAVEKKGLITAITDFIEKHPKVVLGTTGLALFEMHKEEPSGRKRYDHS